MIPLPLRKQIYTEGGYMLSNILFSIVLIVLLVACIGGVYMAWKEGDKLR